MTTTRDLTRIRHNTKIVVTLGPGSNNVDLLEDMIRIGGLNVVRFNFSHGSAEFHQENARIVREAAKRAEREVAIMADLQGPKIRVGKLEGGSVKLEAGEKLLLDAALEGEGNHERIGLDYRDLPRDVSSGDILLLDDGLLTLVVDSVNGSEILTTVQNSHILKSNKGINKQGGGLSAGALTEKDFRDLKTAISIGCDYLAVSFVKSAEDMHIARNLVEAEMVGNTVRPGLVAKIERVEAIKNIDSIIEASDGIMVARGDLAVEVGNAAVPALQKRMIKRAREMRRFTITATQMMESMITNPVPTRAEVSDVANAVLDGTDAVMLSAETAVGAYPFETVRQMAVICAAAEAEQDSLNGVDEKDLCAHEHGTNLAIASGAVHVARAVEAKAIVALTESGSTAFQISRHSIQLPIYALTPSVSAQRRMAMYRGVRPLMHATSTDHDTALDEVEMILVNRKVLESGDKYIITSGSRMRESGSTNMLQVWQLK